MARIQGLPAESGRRLDAAAASRRAWAGPASWPAASCSPGTSDDLVDTTELLVSELVTNALRYGEGEIRLRLLLDRTLVCEVWDSRPGPAAPPPRPRHRRGRPRTPAGRLLSASWGSRRTPRGKTVWFELALPGRQSHVATPTVDELLSMF